MVYLGLAMFRITGSVVFDEALFRFLESTGFTGSTLDGPAGEGDGPGRPGDSPFGGPSIFEAIRSVEAEFATDEADPDTPLTRPAPGADDRRAATIRLGSRGIGRGSQPSLSLAQDRERGRG